MQFAKECTRSYICPGLIITEPLHLKKHVGGKINFLISTLVRLTTWWGWGKQRVGHQSRHECEQRASHLCRHECEQRAGHLCRHECEQWTGLISRCEWTRGKDSIPEERVMARASLVCSIADMLDAHTFLLHTNYTPDSYFCSSEPSGVCLASP